jgi:mono/diheme cytochrome c family protein
MNSAQVRHQKLYFAGKAGNWDLAAFETRQLRGNLRDAAVFYSGIPISNVTTLAERLQAVDDAIEAKNSRRFTQTYGELTNGCNACHQSLGRPFIVMKQPSDQPFGDQQFTPKGER